MTDSIPPYPKLAPAHEYGDYEGVERDLAKLEEHRKVVPESDTETHAKLDFQIGRLRTTARVYRDFAERS